MTAATTTTVDTRHRAPLALARRLARGAAATLAASRARWSDFVDSGQLGPSAASPGSRLTGRWI